jgi:SAM-dependent methyltransferase
MSNQVPWFSEEAGFFGPEYLVEYEETLPHERTIAEVDFVEKTLGLKPGISILDVPCGHGRHSVELAKRGYDVTGSELNRFFLSEAQKAAEAAGVSVRFEQGDMRELNFDGEFDVALNLFTAMGYFDNDEDDMKFMAGVYRALKPGGQFLLDFMNRNWLIQNFKAKDWRELPSGALLLIEREHDDIRGRNLDRRTKIKDGVVGETATTSLRVYTTNELVSMAENVGFTFNEAFGGFESNPLGLNSRRTILHFEKQ